MNKETKEVRERIERMKKIDTIIVELCQLCYSCGVDENPKKIWAARTRAVINIIQIAFQAPPKS